MPLPDDGKPPGEVAFLEAGVFNLGFVAVGAGRACRSSTGGPTGWRASAWSPPQQPLFVDQKWIDLVPCYFRHHVLRDPEVNVAYWNLPVRDAGAARPRGLVRRRPAARVLPLQRLRPREAPTCSASTRGPTRASGSTSTPTCGPSATITPPAWRSAATPSCAARRTASTPAGRAAPWSPHAAPSTGARSWPARGLGRRRAAQPVRRGRRGAPSSTGSPRPPATRPTGAPCRSTRASAWTGRSPACATRSRPVPGPDARPPPRVARGRRRGVARHARVAVPCEAAPVRVAFPGPCTETAGMGMSEVVVVVLAPGESRAGGRGRRPPFQEVAVPTHAEEGCIIYAVHRVGAATPTGLVLVERWASREALDQHLRPRTCWPSARARTTSGPAHGDPDR